MMYLITSLVYPNCVHHSKRPSVRVIMDPFARPWVCTDVISILITVAAFVLYWMRHITAPQLNAVWIFAMFYESLRVAYMAWYRENVRPNPRREKVL